MFGSSKKNTNTVSASNVETLIGKTTRLSGTISSDGSIRVEGSFEGTIESKSDVFIGPLGKVKADITAKNITISGNVEGNMFVDEKLEMMPGAVLNGDVVSKKLVIEDGAIFKGRSETKTTNDTNTIAKNDYSKILASKAEKA